MSEQDRGAAVSREDLADEADELRTVGFRLREIQRLLAVRVEQENRRLEADGVEPVEESRFVAGDDEGGATSN